MKTITAVRPDLTTHMMSNSSPGVEPPLSVACTIEFRDDVCSLLMNDINLNRYDAKFIENILLKYVKNKRGLTAKQDEVFDTIVRKYRKQLKKKANINFNDLLDLSWKTDIVTPEELQNGSYLKVEDGLIKLRFHFNKAMIDEVRTIVHDDKCVFLNKHSETKPFGSGIKYDFNWHADKTEWIGNFDTYLFKALYKYSINHNINIDSSVEELRNNNFGTREEWAPALYKVNGMLYINNIAESMMDQLKEFDFADASMYNIEKIANHLCVEPTPEFQKYKQLMMSRPNSLSTFDTSTTESQAVLKEYLELTKKKTLFHLPSMITTNNASFHFSNLIGSTENKFIVKQEMTNWPNCTVIEKHEALNLDTNKVFEKYDVVISVYTIDNIIGSSTSVGELALNTKFIRIK